MVTDLLERARAAGLVFSLAQDSLRVRGSKAVRNVFRTEIAAAADAIREALVAHDGVPARSEELPADGPLICDDCGREVVVAVCTDYGARYCGRCLRPVRRETLRRPR